MVKTAETAPIDPLQLLKALGPLLSPEGGIKSADEVTRLSSLMKKFSKKLVSRCVYCNVLRTTAPEILTKFLDEHGWETLNSWFQDAKDSDNHSFLRELLKLCKTLPMTVERLKQNNTAKIVRSLSKTESNEEVKVLATDVVESWMSLIKGERSEQVPADKAKKKKKKDVKPSKEKETIEVKETSKEKVKTKHKDTRDKYDFDFKSRPRFEDYEDVKVTIIDEEPLVKRLKIDRPKTVKTFQGKFRSTGLEEETPLPKNVTKKTPSVNKNINVAAVKNAKRLNPVIERFPEKKIKPSSLITPAESSNTGVGIKLIPPKPKPVHVLHESASFMDALVAAPPQPVRRKKKPQVKSPTTPPSPTLTPPKLQFYKETLDMATDESAPDKDSDSDKEKDKIQTRSSTRLKKEAQLKEETASKEAAALKEAAAALKEETKEDNDIDLKDSEKENDEPKSKEGEKESDSSKEDEEKSVVKDEKKENKEENDVDAWTAESPPPIGQLRSILSHCKRKSENKRKVKWAEDASLTSVYYFELDEMERVNVNHIRNFGDLKSLEMKREREAFETARRLMGDKMEEAIPWTTPVRILLPLPLVEPGCNSKEKEIQMERQQTTLQEIYFSKEMLPDSPYEPDPEPHNIIETKSIPLEDENNMGTLMDYSRIDLPAPKPVLPPVLSDLVMSIANKTSQPAQEQVIPNNMFPQLEPVLNFAPISGENGMLPSPGLLGSAPQGFLPQMNPVNEMPNEWMPAADDGHLPTPCMDPYLVCGPMNQPQIQMPLMQNMRPPPGPMMPQRLRIPGPDNMGPRMGRGQQMPRPQGSRSRGPPRVPCKHFWNGTCRYGAKCTFLHPGINGPPL